MSIQIDDQNVALAGENLATVLSAAREQAAALGRVVVEVHYDGEALTGAQITEKRGSPVRDTDIRLYTTEAAELVKSTLDAAKQILEISAKTQVEAAELLQQDDQGQAMQKVGQVLSCWGQAMQAIQQSSELGGVDLNSKSFEGRPVSDLVGDLSKQLKGLRELVEAKDGVGLADALNYEWPETNECWGRLIDALIGWVNE